MTRQKHAAAALAAAIALAVGVILIATSSGGPHPTHPPPDPPRDAPADTPAGAVAAATAWSQSTGAAFVDGTWDSAVSALATPAATALAERDAGPAAALVHRRLAAAGTPYGVRLWPLGYAMQDYSPATARVRVWQLVVLAASGPLNITDFAVTTVPLRWTYGDWKVAAWPASENFAPPRTGASVASWLATAAHFQDYKHVP